MATLRTYSPFRDSSPAALASSLRYLTEFEITSFKFRSSRVGFYLNATLYYCVENQSFNLEFRKCGKYPKFFALSPNFTNFGDLLNYLVHYDDKIDSS